MSRIYAFVLGIVRCGLAAAQAFSVRPVRIVVPFPPVGAVDILGRLV